MRSLQALCHQKLGMIPRTGLILLGCAISLALFSCDGDSGKDAGSTGRPLKVSYQPHLSFAPLMVARHEGYFEDAGLDVEYVSLKRSAHGVAALAKGDLDVLSGFLSVGLLNTIHKDTDIRIVAGKGYAAPDQPSYNVVIGRKDLGQLSDLSAEQLRGCRVLTGVDTFQAPFTERFLAKWDLTLDDVQASRLPPPAQFSAMANGSAELAVMTEPWGSHTVEGDHGILLAHAGEIVPGFQYGYVAFGPSLLQEHPELGRRFMLAYLRAIRQLETGKTTRNVAVLAAASGLDRDILKRVGWPSFRADGTVDTESILEFQSWAGKRGLIDEPIPPQDFWEPQFTEYANRILSDGEM